MSSFIVLGDGRAWAASNWGYDAAVRAIAAEVEESADGREFKDWLLLQTCAHCGPGLGSVDVRELAPDDRVLFEEAALRAIVRQSETGPIGWHDASFFPNWLERFKDLGRMIGSIRAGEPPEAFNPHMTGVIEPSGERVGPGWARIGRTDEAW